jgi:hypothetical protein
VNENVSECALIAMTSNDQSKAVGTETAENGHHLIDSFFVFDSPIENIDFFLKN